MAEENNRIISGEDKIFGINKKAKEMIEEIGKDNVANQFLMMDLLFILMI